jgi:hypothetical protein
VFKGMWQQQLYRKILPGLTFDLRQISQNATELTLFGEFIVLVLNLMIAKEIHVTATINVFTFCKSTFTESRRLLASRPSATQVAGQSPVMSAESLQPFCLTAHLTR